MNPDWKDYETQIFHLIKAEYLDADISHNIFVEGKKSKKQRQIDILILKKKGKKFELGIGECRNIKRKVDITTIDGIIGKMSDVAASFAIIVTTQGYTSSAKKLADNSNIEIKIIPYEFLKDYGFIDSVFLDHEFHAEEIEYDASYCPKCKVTNIYEIKVVRGFADHSWIICPRCKTQLYETRTDGGYRVIKRFPGKNVSGEEIEQVIVDHLLWTRSGWDRKYSWEQQFLEEIQIEKGKNCEICHKVFSPNFHHCSPSIYKKRKICNECFMSRRTLLIDYGKV